MRVRLRTESQSGTHSTLRMFVNGASAGLITVTHEEAGELRELLERTDGGNRGPEPGRKGVGA